MSTNLHPIFADTLRAFGAPVAAPHRFTTGDATGQPAPIPDDDACAVEGLTVAAEVARTRKGDPMPDDERTSRLMALAFSGLNDPTLDAGRRLRYRLAYAAFTRPISSEQSDLTDALKVLREEIA